MAYLASLQNLSQLDMVVLDFKALNCAHVLPSFLYYATVVKFTGRIR